MVKENVLREKYEPRNSNIELYRIITMLLIVAHHYVVNSGLTALDGPIYAEPLSWRSIFLFLFGAWGKIGINCFVLISGYFMCKSQISLKKFVKLLGEVMFYNIAIYVIFLLSGYETFSLTKFVYAFLPVVSVGQGFTSCYILFFLCIPFLNILINNITEKQHAYLLVLLGFIYVFFGTLPLFNVTMNYVSWFIVLYFIAAYIRMYPKKLFDNTRFWGIAMGVSIALSMLSVITCAWLSQIFNKQMAYYLVTDSNTFLAVLTGVSSFMFFKNIKIKNSKFINTVAASTFGVLLIHANSDAMRRWLWQDVLNNVGMYDSNLLVVHAVGSVLAIYTICTILDYLRVRYIEAPFMKYFDKNIAKVVSRYKTIKKKVFNKLKIEN